MPTAPSGVMMYLYTNIKKKECKLKYYHGDLFANLNRKNPTLIAHVCNDVKAFGAGFVLPLAKNFPLARTKFMEVPEGTLGYTQLVEVRETPPLFVANMISQHGVGPDKNGNPPIRYAALVSCMEQVAKFAADHSKLEIVCPKFGSALAGGEWSFIELLIKEIWVDRGIPVTIYVWP